MLYEYKSTNTDEICKYAQRTQTELEAALARSNVERESEELQVYISVKQQ